MLEACVSNKCYMDQNGLGDLMNNVKKGDVKLDSAQSFVGGVNKVGSDVANGDELNNDDSNEAHVAVGRQRTLVGV